MIILGTNSIKDTGYDVANSVRFNSGDSPDMLKNLSDGSRTKWTFSTWFKRSKISSTQYLFRTIKDGNSGNYTYLQLNSSDQLRYLDYTSGNNAELKTNRLFRDVSAWYHVCLIIDTTDGTAGDRQQMYINGVRETSFASSSNYSSSFNTEMNVANYKFNIGYDGDNSGSYYDGYLAETVFLDGTDEAIGSFGEFDSDSPTIWKPIDVSGLSGSKGTNGFYLDYEDSSNLGNDVFGGTDFTETNLTAIDQSTDTCTNNFCTLSPLADSTSILTEGNCVNNADTSQTTSKGSIAVSNGRWYAECKITTSNQYPMLGIWSVETVAFQNPTNTSYPGQVTPSYGGYGNGSIYANGSNTGSQSYTWGNGNIIGIYLDLESSTKTIKWYKDGSSIATLDLATTTDAFVFGDYNSSNALTASWNFGNPAFAISSGNTDANGYGNFEFSPTIGGVDYFAICTKNLSEFG